MTAPQARWWDPEPGGRVRCELCPHRCRIGQGKAGICGVRENQDGRLTSLSYGAVPGFAADPVEKKPLYHWYPGTKVLSFGTGGCPLTCRFCQNWPLSQSRQAFGQTLPVLPNEVADKVLDSGCTGVAFTYNEPAVFAEFALDTAAVCRDRGLKTVAVTSGYFQPQTAREFFGSMDAANVDLKAFTDRFYRRLCGAKLGPVLETLGIIRHETDCWLEITTLLIPGENDSEAEVRDLCRWVLRNLGPGVPLHFSAFRPAHQMLDRQPTPAATVQRARDWGREEGLSFVYTGNIRDREGGTTRCTGCGEALIVRDGFRVEETRLGPGGRCPACGKGTAGRFP